MARTTGNKGPLEFFLASSCSVQVGLIRGGGTGAWTHGDAGYIEVPVATVTEDMVLLGFCRVPLSTEFFRQEHWSELPFPSPGDRPEPEIEPTSLTSPALAGRFFTTSTTWEALRP